MNAFITNAADLEKACAILRALKLDGNKKYFFSVKLWRRKRSLAQNRLLYMWIHCIARETGNTDADIESVVKRECLPGRLVDVNGFTTTVPGRTSVLDTKHFTEFLDRVRLWAGEQGILLPSPGDLGWDEFLAQYDTSAG